MGGNGTHEGNVFLDGMPICGGYSWDIKDAWIVCKQLGFASVVKFTRYSKFGRVNNLFRMREVNCLGTERLLADCPHKKDGSCSRLGSMDGSNMAAGVICSSEYIGGCLSFVYLNIFLF